MTKELQLNSNKELTTYYQNGNERTRALIQAGKFEPSKFELVNSANWSNQFTTMNVKNVEQSIAMPVPSLATINKYKGEELTVALITRMLEEVNAMLNITNKMNEIQMLITSKIVYKNYYYLKISDFRLCFFNAYSGKYGTIFNRVDASVVLEWLNQYNEERLQVAQYVAQKESDKLKQDPKPGEFDREGIKKIISMFKAVEHIKPQSSSIQQFKSLDDYLNTRGLNVSKCNERLNDIFQHEFEHVYERQLFNGDFDRFVMWRKNGILFQVNKGKDIESILNTGS